MLLRCEAMISRFAEKNPDIYVAIVSEEEPSDLDAIDPQEIFGRATYADLFPDVTFFIEKGCECWTPEEDNRQCELSNVPSMVPAKS